MVQRSAFRTLLELQQSSFFLFKIVYEELISVETEAMSRVLAKIAGKREAVRL